MKICYSRFMAERGRPKKQLTVGDDDRKVLEALARRGTTGQALAQRARIILACAEGISNKEAAARCGGWPQTVVSRVWRASGLKPHLTDSWKLSTAPFFIEKVRDVVGLYLNPPEKAMVLCVDEKSQIQALDRSAPVL